mmetsp:Transcript_41286/g.102750  ORF Transcript_41286/g.102750 Transcript_41286/m.102750 type:complete len:128 (-) Transcript_41286:2-385(-)|eukprot:433304-Prymnesium_polylepis.1
MEIKLENAAQVGVRPDICASGTSERLLLEQERLLLEQEKLMLLQQERLLLEQEKLMLLQEECERKGYESKEYEWGESEQEPQQDHEYQSHVRRCGEMMAARIRESSLDPMTPRTRRAAADMVSERLI